VCRQWLAATAAEAAVLSGAADADDHLRHAAAVSVDNPSW
jgi:hypothetical protein